MSARDDDALSWGDDDPTLEGGAPRDDERRTDDEAPAPADAGREDALGREGAAEGPGPDDADDAPGAMGSVALVSYGVLAGIYALYVLGWALGGFRLRDRIQIATGAVADVMFQGAMWLGMLAPVIWFVVTVYATRNSPRWRRFAGLAIGMLLLVPWPFVMTGAVGR
jgi:hypothetical protein